MHAGTLSPHKALSHTPVLLHGHLYTYVYMHAHTHTHTHYIYIYIYILYTHTCIIIILHTLTSIIQSSRIVLMLGRMPGCLTRSSVSGATLVVSFALICCQRSPECTHVNLGKGLPKGLQSVAPTGGGQATLRGSPNARAVLICFLVRIPIKFSLQAKGCPLCSPREMSCILWQFSFICVERNARQLLK